MAFLYFYFYHALNGYRTSIACCIMDKLQSDRTIACCILDKCRSDRTSMACCVMDKCRSDRTSIACCIMDKWRSESDTGSHIHAVRGINNTLTSVLPRHFKKRNNVILAFACR
jgi:hypothetical protein